ncbi:PilT domain-containing protein [mine drainage metagenome]|uniref:PilT domain-containing protein n=1 Tax=mine drainage metagenome TaxID=410659 RepID=T1AKE7_9ZZZZ
MIILDTNVISELMRPMPASEVMSWMAAQPRGLLHTTTINQAEILYGIAALPEGRRRQALARAAEAMFAEDFAGRILPFGSAAAACYAGIVMKRRLAGSPIEGFDGVIAAVAVSAGARVATRDCAGFSGCGLTLIDPWRASSS